MKTYTLHRRQYVNRPIAEVFAFFADATNLDRLTPPWLSFRVETPTPIVMQPGTRIQYSIYWHRLRMRWLTEIVEWVPGQRFVDVQLKGPYRHWHHTHSFEATGGGTTIEDLVRYALPFGPLGRAAHALLVRRDVNRIFDYRHRRIEEIMGSDSGS